MSWQALENANPELAAFGSERFSNRVAYLATVRKDGSPRVHPVAPIIGQGRLYIFMEPTSPKRGDLLRDGRYAMHSLITDYAGSDGEFIISGRARLVEDEASRKLAAQSASYTPADRFILFELDVEDAMSTLYSGGQVIRKHWKRGE
ncbi:MAG TPA: pyridoxamine 5'-phosphate oxidase family protein [Anaerolineae bacterium]